MKNYGKLFSLSLLMGTFLTINAAGMERKNTEELDYKLSYSRQQESVKKKLTELDTECKNKPCPAGNEYKVLENAISKEDFSGFKKGNESSADCNSARLSVFKSLTNSSAFAGLIDNPLDKTQQDKELSRLKATNSYFQYSWISRLGCISDERAAWEIACNNSCYTAIEDGYRPDSTGKFYDSRGRLYNPAAENLSKAKQEVVEKEPLFRGTPNQYNIDFKGLHKKDDRESTQSVVSKGPLFKDPVTWYKIDPKELHKKDDRESTQSVVSKGPLFKDPVTQYKIDSRELHKKDDRGFTQSVVTKGPLVSGKPIQYDIGFKELYQKGYKGCKQRVALIESEIGFDKSHPAFVGRNINCFDVGRSPDFDCNFEDKSKLRYTNFPTEEIDLNFHSPMVHAQTVAGILVGNLLTQNNFEQGIIEECNLTLISFSQPNSDKIKVGWTSDGRVGASTALYPFNNSGFTSTEKQKKALIQYSSVKKIDFFPRKIDDSVYDAFELAFQSTDRVISASFDLQSPCDYQNNYYLSDLFINFLAENLEKNDQILVFSAGNSAQDISESTTRGLAELEELNKLPLPDNYCEKASHLQEIAKAVRKLSKAAFLQYANHPILKNRILVVVAAKINDETVYQNFRAIGKSSLKFTNGREYNVCLEENSNYPGNNKDLQAITVAAFAKNIMVAGKNHSFYLDSGTSLATPMVTGLISLMDGHYKKLGRVINGANLLALLKKGCLVANENMRGFYGNGLIDPLSFLKEDIN